jgi:hypothetical protein
VRVYIGVHLWLQSYTFIWLHAYARAHLMSICMMRRILDVHLTLADPG